MEAAAKLNGTLIKWPGGKGREIKQIEKMVPAFERYIEPFFGGGAMFFYLRPRRAMINDISRDLMDFYRLIKEKNTRFIEYLSAYDRLMASLLEACARQYKDTCGVYGKLRDGSIAADELKPYVKTLSDRMLDLLDERSMRLLLVDRERFVEVLTDNAADKMIRTVGNELSSPYSPDDLKENLATGFISGMYMYFRDIYNDILLKRTEEKNEEYRIANFYFIREYCYGSMFRYNKKGEFNIPYGGMSYNRKRFGSKIEGIYSAETEELFSGTDICCLDFAEFLDGAELTESDFIFLDPPYDTDFSDYEGRSFDKNDHKRLAELLKNTRAKFILIIKNTDYIYSLYEGCFTILSFDKQYTYNVRSRNDRRTEHLIITNII